MSAPNHTLTICLLGASYNTGNRGVAALASGTVNSVMHSHPDATLFLFDYDRLPSFERVRYAHGTADIELVNVRFSWRVWLRNNIIRLLVVGLVLRLLPIPRLRQWVMSHHPHLRRLNDADAVVSIGAGDSFADVYGLARLVYVALPQILALLLKKPLVQLPQTIGPFHGVIAKILARYILRRASRVYSRDPESSSLARRFMKDHERRVDLAYDMAFALEPIAPDRDSVIWFSSPSPMPIVGINPSGLLYLGGYTRNNMFHLKADYPKLVSDILSLFVEQLRCRVVLVPHAYKLGDTSESDTIACRAALEQGSARFGNRVHYVGEHLNEGELKYLIGQCEFFIGSRMHACIAALSQSVPAVGMAYSGKFVGIWRMLDVEELVLDLRCLDAEIVMIRLRELFDSRLRIRAKLEGKMPAIRKSVLSLFSDLPLR